MATIVLRDSGSISSPEATVKGSPLTNLEVDNNFSNINISVGVLSNLSTGAKSNLVIAVNELKANINSILSGNIGQFAATTSAILATEISDETGTGNLVFNTSPVLFTPNLGTPSYIVLTNATGTASSLSVGSATTATSATSASTATYSTGAGNSTNIGITDDTSTNATFYPVISSATTGNVAQKVSSTKLTFNPSTGLLTSTDYNSSSDITLKENITPINDPLAILERLNGFAFTWRDTKEKSYGLSAQEVEQVLPEIVRDRPDGVKGINYLNLIAFLVEAIKDLKREIQELKSDK
jgi:hypothetical protein